MSAMPRVETSNGGGPTRGRPKRRADGSIEPYEFTQIQRTIVLMIHQQRRPLSINDILAVMFGCNAPSSQRERIKQVVVGKRDGSGGGLVGDFLIEDEEGKYALTGRAMEIAINITAASLR